MISDPLEVRVLEALEPHELTELLTGAIEHELDREIYDATLEREREIRDDLIRRIDEWRAEQ